MRQLGVGWGPTTPRIRCPKADVEGSLPDSRLSPMSRFDPQETVTVLELERQVPELCSHRERRLAARTRRPELTARLRKLSGGSPADTCRSTRTGGWRIVHHVMSKPESPLAGYRARPDPMDMTPWIGLTPAMSTIQKRYQRSKSIVDYGQLITEPTSRPLAPQSHLGEEIAHIQ